MNKSIKIIAVVALILSIALFSSCGKKAPGPVKSPTPGRIGPADTTRPHDLTGDFSNVVLPYYDVKVMGNSSFLAGSLGAMRIITYNPVTQNPVGEVPVSIFFTKMEKGNANKKGAKDATGQKELIFSKKTDKNGSVDVSFKIPEGREGDYKMEVVTGYKGKHTSVDANIKIVKKFKIYLTVDKPKYQPGQKMNIRALVLDIPNLKPLAEKEITLEVHDSKGNKVFKYVGKTSKYGIASAVFQIAGEVNMGAYKVKAVIGENEAGKDVEVKKYVLPKFKVTFKKDRKYYAPDDTLKGEIQADYFFGKPVSGGKVFAQLKMFDMTMRSLGKARGRTDKNGNFKFEMKIPGNLVGSALAKGNVNALMEVVVTDTANHKERTYRSVVVSFMPLKVELFPESGNLRPGIENLVYVMTSYPDGSPVEATVNMTVQGEKKSIVTDAAGIGSFKFTPDRSKIVTTSPSFPPPMYRRQRLEKRRSMPVEVGEPSLSPSRKYIGRRPIRHPRTGIPVKIHAYTPKGDKFKTVIYLNVAGGKENIIVRPNKASYKVGDTLKIEILTTSGQGSCYLDFVKNNQTISTHAVPLSGKIHPFSVEATPDMSGMVTIHGYRITDKNLIIRDTRNIFIRRADDLAITAALDQKEYKPGQKAKIQFNVKDKKGSPVAAALGVDIVDEAVFAMGQMRPGLEKAYFLLTKQLMTPKYEVRGTTIRHVVLSDEEAKEDQQIIERVLFSKIPVGSSGFSVNLDSYNKRIQECYKKMMTIQTALHNYYRKNRSYPTDINVLLNVPRTRKQMKAFSKPLTDPWGNKFYLKPNKSDRLPPIIMTIGLDGKKNTKDDMTYQQVSQENWRLNPRVPKYGLEREGRGEILRRRQAVPSMATMDAEKATGAPMKKERKAAGESPGKTKAQAPIKIREYFPETLYTNPQIITDENGNAEIDVKMADSITTWRMAVFANSLKGQMGNVTEAIRVFQEFFVDIDFPVSLTKDDEVSVPIAVHNHLKEKQTVKLTVDKSEKWFELIGPDEKTVEMNPGQVKAVYFRIKVKKIGNHTFTVQGRGSKLSDAIRRKIEVLPNGRLFTWTKSDRLEQNSTINVNIPENALPDASKILVRLYPGVMSQVVEGLDKIFRMPHGCFEQTTAATYPNVMVLDYLKRQKKIKPDLQMKAESYINTGYQRLLSFQVQGGGFSLYGKSPAVVHLTAMGIMEFRDMSKVHDVDENVINGAQNWLVRQQKPDGSYNSNLRTTAYIVWALAESGYKGNGLNRAVVYLKRNYGQINDPYILALMGGALANLEPNGKLTNEILNKLKEKANITKDTAYWGTKVPTIMHSRGNVANIETTALAAIAFMRAGKHLDLASKAVTYLVQSKDPRGTWYSTQSTVLAMKALIMAHEMATKEIDAKVKITVNGKQTEEFRINSENYDVYNQADFSGVTVRGKNKVEISIIGKGSCFYQVVAKYYMPWVKEKPAEKPISITMKYDRTSLATDETITCAVYVRNNTRKRMKNVIIDLGIPPGFDLVTSDLDKLVGTKFERYDSSPTRIIIYTDGLKEGETMSFKYRLRARFPLKAKTPDSTAYLYYAPDIKGTAEPVELVVK